MEKKYLNRPFTMVPNICFDKYMVEMTPNEFQVYLFVIRKTVGFHKRSDIISLSQFEKFVGSTIPTIRKAIEGLIEKEFVKRIPEKCSYKYILNKPPKIYSDIKQIGNSYEKNLQDDVKETFNESCKNFTTQKKEQKKNLNNNMCDRSKFRSKIPTKEVYTVIDSWNNQFRSKIDRDDPSWLDHIGEVLCYFRVEEIKQAMDNRLTLDLYRTEYPYLLHRPKAFFEHLETIENDLKASKSKIMPHGEMVKLITEEGYKEEDFSIRWDLPDEEGNPKRELITDRQTTQNV
ncbi:replication protein [Fodinibius sp. AD559]|uniref:replication protein n=1 Tax=Fodinibius sp. AD559 TaxID=3424179 RepID=UPI004046B2B1